MHTSLRASIPGVAVHLVFSDVAGTGEGDLKVDADEGGEGVSITVLLAMIDEVATAEAGTMGTISTSMLLVSSTGSGPDVLGSSGVTVSPGGCLHCLVLPHLHFRFSPPCHLRPQCQKPQTLNQSTLQDEIQDSKCCVGQVQADQGWSQNPSCLGVCRRSWLTVAEADHDVPGESWGCHQC